MSKVVDKEPVLKGNDKISFIRALNYYSQYHSFEDSKKWALDWLSEQYPSIYGKIKDAKDYQFSNRGFICRMIKRGYNPSLDMVRELIGFFESINPLAKKAESEVDSGYIPRKMNQPNMIVCALEDVIDSILSEKELPQIQLPVEPKVLKDARLWCDTQMIEFQEQVNKYQSLIDYFKDITVRISDIEEGSIKSIVKKPEVSQTRSQELRNAAKLVEMVRCPLKIEEFGFVGLSPIKIIGSKKIMVYNTESRRAMVYVAMEGETLSVSRTAIKNFDESRSLSKTIRKPGNFFLALNNKANPFKLFDNTSTTPQQARCRLNEEVVIIAVS